MTTKTKPSPVTLLIEATMSLTDQLKTLEELIATTPFGSPSVVLDITPDLAREILDHRNLNNRRPRPVKIKRFASDLAAGFWALTGDTIKFGTNGVLLDGQNRLRACVAAGVNLKTHVVFSVDPVAFKYLDTGTVRTGGDMFKTAGVSYPEIAWRATRWIMILTDPSVPRGLVVPNSDLFEYYQKHTIQNAFEEAISRANKVSRHIPTGALAAMFYLFARRDAPTAAIFAHDLEKEVRGARVLLRRIRNMRRENLGRMNEKQITALTTMTWNAYRQDGGVIRGAQLKWTEGDSSYPTIE